MVANWVDERIRDAESVRERTYYERIKAGDSLVNAYAAAADAAKAAGEGSHD